MAYISAEEVKKIRDKIKKEFKNFKFSITKEHSMTVNVDILEGDIDFYECLTEKEYYENRKDRLYIQVNEYHIDKHFTGEAMKMLLRIKDIITSCKSHYDRNFGDMGADYADFNYFYNISIGRWDKPYVLKGVVKNG